MDLPSWLTAIGTMVLAIPVFLSGIYWIFVKPMTTNIDENHRRLALRLDSIERNNKDWFDEHKEALKDLRDNFDRHAFKDTEQFDDIEEKFENKLSVTRSEINQHNSAENSRVRDDLKTLGQRLDVGLAETGRRLDEGLARLMQLVINSRSTQGGDD